MSPQEHITVCASEEANEVAEIAFELGRIAMKFSKDLHKALRFGFTDTDPVSGKTKIEMLTDEINDLQGCIELLQDSGIELPSLFNRIAIDAKKAKVKRYMGIAEELGTIKKDTIPIKTKPIPLTLAQRDRAIQCLTKIYNPVRQKEFANQFYDYVVDKIKKQFMPDGVGVILSDRFCDEVLMFKDQIVKSLITGHRYCNLKNKDYMEMLDVQIIAEMNKITIQANSPLEVLMHGVAPVNFFIVDDIEDIAELWEKHKHEFQ